MKAGVSYAEEPPSQILPKGGPYFLLFMKRYLVRLPRMLFALIAIALPPNNAPKANA